jgi:diaminopimelate decarboxylase
MNQPNISQKHNTRQDILNHHKNLRSSGLLSEQDNAFILIDFTTLHNRLNCVSSAFGHTFKHSVAVKSNPLTKVLKSIASKGFGFECASFEEVLQAERVNQNQLIIWDSPAKTKLELESSKMIANLIVNANDLFELNRIISIDHKAIIGLRINPLSSGTNITSMNVSSEHSKFGEPISSRNQILDILSNAPSNVCAVHVHLSSQNVNFDVQVDAIRSVLDLALEVNSAAPNKIKYFNMGGGFPVSYHQNVEYSIFEYSEKLRTSCPELFDGQFETITEFGRYYHAHSGIAYSKIEHVKYFDQHQTIINHLGADFFLRECYNPDQWSHEFSVLRNDSFLENELTNTDIGGPLCFGGDYISKNTLLPKVSPDDTLVIADVGANTFSLWSRHCSRPFPKILGFENGIYFIVKEKETAETVLQFWD